MLVAPVARMSREVSVFSGGMSPTTEPRGFWPDDDDLLAVIFGWQIFIGLSDRLLCGGICWRGFLREGRAGG